jgi:phosphorylase superfamily protein
MPLNKNGGTPWDIITRLVAGAPHRHLVILSVEILAPTFLEYWAVRRTLPYARTSRAGVRLARWKGARQGSIVVVCGLAGALAPGLRPGTVLIPDWVGLADGRIVQCDPALVQALVTAACRLRFRPETGPLLTAHSLIVGGDRYDWSQRGFVAADMETGLLAGRNLRVATIRVVLDSPEHGISPDWLRPTRALLQPPLWRELFWLSRVAPQYALRAAHVLKVGLGTGPGSIFAE